MEIYKSYLGTVTVREKYEKYEGMSDKQLYAACFDIAGDEHPVCELIRRNIVTLKRLDDKERDYLKAKKAAEEAKKEWEEKAPFVEVEVDAVDLLNKLGDAIKIAMDFDHEWETEYFDLTAKDGSATPYDLGVSKDEEKYCIKIEFKK